MQEERSTAQIFAELDHTLNEREFVLVGIGEEWAYLSENENSQPDLKERLLAAYTNLHAFLKGKTYFILTQNEDDLIFQSPFMDFLVAAPNSMNLPEETKNAQWDSYLNYLTGTMGHSLAILELGVGFTQPELIRWPFEKCVQVNTKAKLVRIHHALPMLPEGMGERGSAVKCHAVSLFAAGKNEEEITKL